MLLGSSTSLLVGWLAFATAVRGLAIPGYPFHSPFGSSGASKHALGYNGYNWGCIYDFADEIIRRHKAGHIIASHTWSHVEITKMAPDALAQQLDLVDEALWKIIGVKPKFFRPPYGKHNAASIEAVKARNMTKIMWSFSSEDAVGKTPEQSLKEYGSLMKHFPAQEIALNHEIKEGTAQTVVPHILPRLIAKGYKLVTVDECLGVEPYREVGTLGVRDATWTCSGTPRPGQRRGFKT
ncbi:hypothetical protein MVLG_03734 [Microbotryum lychnidis-dioicae p1A1 Lamole]|uniref:NodB homology domain-containing protein n=1 Tax=Microbotryum lychnidis-dioicae (strain p1A1 Lamole / MvSl-1064) TaxID=683840 RepID=U5H939_USTV1|nr:hypothetical protein MVLG_03734 [Microbotryum lychnidis-dioicae p1A1 Lamole]|eukprot:KDE05921.1 hypothetical protein MVLG_03734 [Microbotryum lychnidis-dioicae p1A1 Lamole]